MEERIFWTTKKDVKILLKDLNKRHLDRILVCLDGNGKTEIPEPYYSKTRQEWKDLLLYEVEIRKGNKIIEVW